MDKVGPHTHMYTGYYFIDMYIQTESAMAAVTRVTEVLHHTNAEFCLSKQSGEEIFLMHF